MVNQVLFGNSEWVAVGNQAWHAAAPSGSFAPTAIGTVSSASYQDLTYDGTYWVTVSSTSTSNLAYVTGDIESRQVNATEKDRVAVSPMRW